MAVPQIPKGDPPYLPHFKEGDNRDKDDKRPEIGRIWSDFKVSLDQHDNYITVFDDWEAMLNGSTRDGVSQGTKSRMTDSATTTIYLERAARVVSTLPSGVIRAAGKKDDGKAALMSIIVQKYLYPNMNSQFRFLEKLRSWQFYSSVYGYMLMHYDWCVGYDGYIGPDCWLWHPRNFVPQPGYASIDDMEYCYAIAYVDADTIDAYLDAPDDAGWDKVALRRLKTSVVAVNSNTTKGTDPKRDSYITRARSSSADQGKIMFVTRYESGDDGHWVTFAPEYNSSQKMSLRDIPNPHKNGKIPFVKKSCIQTMDSFYDLGDFQRARPIQFAMDGLTNFYFESIKRSLSPPIVANPNGVVKHTVNNSSNNVILETIPNSIRELSVNNSASSTYQAVMTQFKGQLLNQAGTTDTSLTASDGLDPGFGKTPQAVQAQQQRVQTRDAQDLFYLESSIETLVNRMIDLIPTIATENIPVDIFSDDVQDIVKGGYEDVMQMLEVSSSGQSARLTIKPNQLKNAVYRFQMDANSTVQQSKAAQLQAVQTFGQTMSSNQNLLTQLQERGQVYDVAKQAEIVGYLSDVPQLTELVRPMNEQEKQAYQQSQQAQQQQQKMAITANYKDLPPDAQTQALIADGYKSKAQLSLAQEIDAAKVQANIENSKEKLDLQTRQQQHNEASAESMTPEVQSNFVHPHIAQAAQAINAMRSNTNGATS